MRISKHLVGLTVPRLEIIHYSESTVGNGKVVALSAQWVP
jgi:hypothetical protein